MLARLRKARIMRKMLLPALLLVFGCETMPLTPEERTFREVKWHCREVGKAAGAERAAQVGKKPIREAQPGYLGPAIPDLQGEDWEQRRAWLGAYRDCMWEFRDLP